MSGISKEAIQEAIAGSRKEEANLEAAIVAFERDLIRVRGAIEQNELWLKAFKHAKKKRNPFGDKRPLADISNALEHHLTSLPQEIESCQQSQTETTTWENQKGQSSPHKDPSQPPRQDPSFQLKKL